MSYRDHFLDCPRCRTALESAGSGMGCRGCGGRWIDEAIVTEMVHEMHDGQESAPLVFEARRAEAEPLACPSCDRPMAPLRLEEVRVERCEPHGIWFDGTELQTTLYNASKRAPRLRALIAR